MEKMQKKKIPDAMTGKMRNQNKSEGEIES